MPTIGQPRPGVYIVHVIPADPATASDIQVWRPARPAAAAIAHLREVRNALPPATPEEIALWDSVLATLQEPRRLGGRLTTSTITPEVRRVAEAMSAPLPEEPND